MQSINNVIVIDHHRRSENVIKNALLIYIEPYSSSTSELVTELLMYFNENIKLSRLEATALYSGIVVDTKTSVSILVFVHLMLYRIYVVVVLTLK